MHASSCSHTLPPSLSGNSSIERPRTHIHFVTFAYHLYSDWSNAKQIWANAHPMSAEELLVEQAKRRKAAICPHTCPYPAGCPTKAACPQAKTWVYRNFVKALPWYSSVREKLEDPQYSGFFLKFNPHNTTPYAVPPCDANFSPAKCSAFYHDQEQTPGYPKGDGSCAAPCDCGQVPCGE